MLKNKKNQQTDSCYGNVSSALKDLDDNVKGYQGIIQDISERKKNGTTGDVG